MQNISLQFTELDLKLLDFVSIPTVGSQVTFFNSLTHQGRGEGSFPCLSSTNDKNGFNTCPWSPETFETLVSCEIPAMSDWLCVSKAHVLRGVVEFTLTSSQSFLDPECFDPDPD